jgi:peptide chain release factor 3
MNQDLTLQEEVKARRTFAIISHPDAGKTTLTEKLLLYSGMIRTAGMVRARKGGKSTSSDWMSLEQERGISISASAMQFRYKDAVINVLDTPGHQDFSEDTYRTLTAADSAIMVLDAAKGVETQTRKLFSVCALRKLPILTFINKMDLPGLDPLELLHVLEDALGIAASPLNWPIGSGRNFVGVVDIRTKQVNLFKKSEVGGADRASIETCSLSDLEKRQDIDKDIVSKVLEDLELLAEAGNPFSSEEFLKGKVTPVFFGSALTNFGVEPFYDAFVELAPSPRSYRGIKVKSQEEIVVNPLDKSFSGYVFKVQANMNPKHRDSMAFIRVCSGCFERDMSVKHHRLNKEIRLSRAYSMAGQDRNTTEVAYAGDIVGCINPGVFAIGDTVSENADFNFPALPQFPPELVGQLRPLDILRHKSFEKGIAQLSQEGTVQILRSYENPSAPPYVAAVGKLQFEVMQYRLEDEYKVRTDLSLLPYRYSAYLEGNPATLNRPSGSFLAKDTKERVVILFTSEWEKNFTRDKNPDHKVVDFAL